MEREKLNKAWGVQISVTATEARHKALSTSLYTLFYSVAKVAYKINIWLKYLPQLKKSWIRKGKLSKSSKEFCRIHFYTGSTISTWSVHSRFYLIVVLEIAQGEKKKRFSDFMKSHNCIRFWIQTLCFWRTLSQKTTPKPNTLRIQIQTSSTRNATQTHPTECFSFPLSCIAVGREDLFMSYIKASDQHTGKTCPVLSTPQYHFTELQGQ